MRALVTGATGFIGSRLVKRLVETGYEVRAFVRESSELGALVSLPIEIMRGDVRNAPDVERAVDECDLVFHLAVVRGRRDLTVGATEIVARAAARAGVARFVFPSSTRVYGLTSKRLINEATPIRPDASHGGFKAECEKLLLDRRAGNGPPVVIARLPLVLGSGDTAWRDVFLAVASGRFRCIGAGRNHCHPVDVSDAAEGLLLCGTVPGIEGRIYIIAGAEPRPLREIIGCIGRLFGVSTSRSVIPAVALHCYRLLNSIVFACGGPDLPRFDRVQLFLQDYRFDLSRARTELRYVPKVSLEQTLRQTGNWYRDQGYLSVRERQAVPASRNEG